MSVTPYRAFSWQPFEAITTDRENQLANNVQWLYENTPRALYTSGGTTTTEGVRIAAGLAPITKRNSDTASVTVRFGDFFSDYCKPIITDGIISNNHIRIFKRICGIGGLQPDNTGFKIVVEIDALSKKKDKITKQFYVTWMAVGY